MHFNYFYYISYYEKIQEVYKWKKRDFSFQMKECCSIHTNINNFLKIEQKIPLQRHEIFREVLYDN